MRRKIIFLFLIIGPTFAQEIYFSKDSLNFQFGINPPTYSPEDSVIIKNIGDQGLLIDTIYSIHGIGYGLFAQYHDSLYQHYIFDPANVLNLLIAANDSAKFKFINPDLCPICSSAGYKFFTDSIIIHSNSISSARSYLYVEGYGYTSVSDNYLMIDKYVLEQNYPNPFNPTTTIRYRIPEAGLVTLKVYDVLGKEIATLVNEEKLTGSYEVEFDGSNLSSGIYFYRLQVGNFSDKKKFILLK